MLIRQHPQRLSAAELLQSIDLGQAAVTSRTEPCPARRASDADEEHALALRRLRHSRECLLGEVRHEDGIDGEPLGRVVGHDDRTQVAEREVVPGRYLHRPVAQLLHDPSLGCAVGDEDRARVAEHRPLAQESRELVHLGLRILGGEEHRRLDAVERQEVRRPEDRRLLVRREKLRCEVDDERRAPIGGEER